MKETGGSLREQVFREKTYRKQEKKSNGEKNGTDSGRL